MKKIDLLVLAILLFIGFWVVDSTVLFLKNYIEKRKFSRIRMNIAKDLLLRALRKDKKYSAMDLKDRIENEIYYVKLKKIIIEVIYRYVLIIGSFIFMLSINLWFTIFAILSIPLAKLVLKIVQKKMVRYSSEYRNVYVEYENWLVQCINNRDSIKINAYEKNVETIFLKRWGTLAKLYMKKQICFVTQYCLNQFKDTYIIKLNLYFLGILFISKGYISVGVLLAFMKYYEKSVSTLAEINELNVTGESINPYIDKIDELFDEDSSCPVDVDKEDTNMLLNNVDVVFDKMSIINKMNLEIPKRKHLLITGESGAGKTTLLNVLAGIQEPTAGEIFIGQQPIHKLSLEQLSSIRSLVRQNSYFFKLSVMENFRLANIRITDAQIVDI